MASQAPATARDDEDLLREILLAWPRANQQKRSQAYFLVYRHVIRSKREHWEGLAAPKGLSRRRKRGILFWDSN